MRHCEVYNNRQVNLESHQLVWLDPDFNRKNATNIEHLRKIVDYTKVFESNEDCLKYIKQTQDTTTFLVCTKELAQEFIPQLHHFKHVLKIYITPDIENHQKWVSNYSKVVEGNKEISHLLNNVSADVNEYQKHEKQVDFSEFDKVQTTADNYNDSWWYGFIRLIVELPYPTDSYRKLVEFLQVYYDGKTAELSILSEFEANYRSNQAVWWYTRPTFLFDLLNKTLRQHNIKMMFLLGFFVQDLYRQLKTEFELFRLRHLQDQSILKSYRGQIIHIDELKKFKVGLFIINNSFFSTSFNRHVALIFVNPSLKSDDQLQSVLFEFEIDVRQQTLNPFADISSQSHFQEELEILFMIGCRFEIQDIYYDENEKYWLVKMGLVYAYHRQDYRIYENMSDTTFRRTLIYCVSKLSISVTRASEQDINILFNELIDLFPAEEKWISAIKSQCLAGHKFKPKLYHTEPITYFEQALKIWNDYIEDDEFNCLTIIGEIHKQMGVWYEIRHPTDKNLAITHCDLAISYMKSAIERTQTDYERIETLNRLASIYDCKMNISNNIKENAMMCIKYLQLAIQEMLKYYSKHDYMIISRVKDLAEYLVLVNKYDDALLNYQNVLDIYLQQPKPPSGWIDNVYKNMVNIYIKYKHDYDSGLRYQLFSHEFTLKFQMHDRIYDIDYNNYKKDNMAISYEKLSVIYIKLGQYNLAYKNLMIALKLHEEMLQSSDICDTICKMAKTKVELADISVKLHQYDLASEHLESAIRLCEGRSRLYHENIKIANIYIKLANSYTELQEYDLVDENLARALNIYRNYNDSQYEFKGRVTRLVNGRIKRCKRSATIVYIAKYDHIRTYIIAFLDNKITALSHRLVYDEIRRVYKRHK